MVCEFSIGKRRNFKLKLEAKDRRTEDLVILRAMGFHLKYIPSFFF